MNKEPIQIELWQSPGFFLIQEWPSSIWYSNQCGGTTCAHPVVEGFLVPLDQFKGDKDEICDFLEDRWFRGGSLSEEEVEKLKVLVTGFGPVTNEWLELDVSRLNDEERFMGEAWIPVRTPWGAGWLTWENSD